MSEGSQGACGSEFPMGLGGSLSCTFKNISLKNLMPSTLPALAGHSGPLLFPWLGPNPCGPTCPQAGPLLGFLRRGGGRVQTVSLAPSPCSDF